jgi:hypothetical protein
MIDKSIAKSNITVDVVVIFQLLLIFIKTNVNIFINQ